MPIEEGQYYIYSALGDIQVGRLRFEDFSLFPKRVVSLAPGEKPNSPWTVVKDGENKFTLKAGGAPTSVIEHKLYAILLDTPSPTAWKLTKVARHGENAFIITTEDGLNGWVLNTSEPYTQVSVRPLIVGPSDPPTFPGNEVFIFKAVDKN